MSTVDAFLFVIVGVLVIAATARIAPRLGIAGPLVLVIIGIAASYIPFVPDVHINPEWILVGVLPPLLYSAAVSVPAVEFRRDLLPIAGLAFILVFLSSLILGAFFYFVIPGLGIPLSIALGAILSPTDAVATTVAKRLGVSRRVVTMLEGESMLNDASALVILNSAVAAFALSSTSPQSLTLLGSIGGFAWTVIIAVAVGVIVGMLNLRVRSWLRNSAASTAVGFVVPFVAYLPTEHLGGSGLVAAVVAGIVTGQGAARWFTPEQRLSDQSTWRTVELLLEGGVFLVMGLEMSEIVSGTVLGAFGIGHGLLVAAVALGILLAARAGYVGFVLWLQSHRAHPRRRERLDRISDRVDRIAAAGPAALADRGRHMDERQFERRLSRARRVVSRSIADMDYYRDAPLTPAHGTILVWAGMRGVVTLAAAQTLPEDAPSRHFLVFIAFTVALLSLMLQGFTLPRLVKRLPVSGEEDDQVIRREQEEITRELHLAAARSLNAGGLTRRDGTTLPSTWAERVGPAFLEATDAEADEVQDTLELRLALVLARRNRLNELSAGGTYGSAALRLALAELDAAQLSIEVRMDD